MAGILRLTAGMLPFLATILTLLAGIETYGCHAETYSENAAVYGGSVSESVRAGSHRRLQLFPSAVRYHLRACYAVSGTDLAHGAIRQTRGIASTWQYWLSC
eukprot:2086405-Rhodomonas_salina.7